MGLDFGMPKESVALWFGIMILMVVSFGPLVPPMGLNVYVVNGLARAAPLARPSAACRLPSSATSSASAWGSPSGIALRLVKFISS